MRKLLLLAIFGVFVFSSCQKGAGDSYTLQGHLLHFSDSVLYLTHQEGNIPLFDTLLVKNGEFTYTGKIQNPTFAQIVTADQSNGFPLILEPGTIKIDGDADSMSVGKISVSGTPNNDDLNDFMEMQRPFMQSTMQLQSEYMQAKMKNDTATISRLENTMDSLQNAITAKMKGFVQAHPKSLVSGMALQGMMNTVSTAELETLYNGLDTSIQHGEFGMLIKSKIDADKKTSIGMVAPNFTMDDTAGNPVSLASFRGKYVLLDFWASWCGPCRAENPNVVKAYNEFKDKNFTILSVSLDRDKASWEKAIADDHLTWNHVSDLQYWDNAAAKLYGVQAIPANFLLGPDGKIIAKDLRGDKLEQELSSVIK